MTADDLGRPDRLGRAALDFRDVLDAVRRRSAMRVIRCESCSSKLGDLSLLFIRGEITRDEWSRRAYKGVQAHHAGWTLSQVWNYAKVRAPFYPWGDPDEHRYPGERVTQ